MSPRQRQRLKVPGAARRCNYQPGSPLAVAAAREPTRCRHVGPVDAPTAVFVRLLSLPACPRCPRALDRAALAGWACRAAPMHRAAHAGLTLIGSGPRAAPRRAGHTTAGRLCADLHGPYKALIHSCNATCNACAFGPPENRTCEQYGIEDDDATWLSDADNFFRGSVGCRQTYRAGLQTWVFGRYDPSDQPSWVATANTVGYYGGVGNPHCPVTTGFCRSELLVPFQRYFTKTASNSTAVAQAVWD